MSAGSGIIWRILEADAVVGGHAIPRGATVVAPIGCIHHDAKHWPDPEKFDPSRFLEGEETNAAAWHDVRVTPKCTHATGRVTCCRLSHATDAMKQTMLSAKLWLNTPFNAWSNEQLCAGDSASIGAEAKQLKSPGGHPLAYMPFGFGTR